MLKVIINSSKMNNAYQNILYKKV